MSPIDPQQMLRMTLIHAMLVTITRSRARKSSHNSIQPSLPWLPRMWTTSQ